MKIKPILFFLFAILLHYGSMQAQNPSKTSKYTPEQRAKKHLEMMQKDLSMSEDQSAKAYEYVYAFEQKRVQDQAAMKTNRDELDKNLSTVLDADQMAKYKEIRAQKAKKLQERYGKKQNGPPPASE